MFALNYRSRNFLRRRSIIALKLGVNQKRLMSMYQNIYPCSNKFAHLLRISQILVARFDFSGYLVQESTLNTFITKTAFTRYRHILKTVKNVTVAKFELAFTRYRNNLKTVGNLTAKNSLQDFDAKEMYLHSKNRSVSFQMH